MRSTLVIYTRFSIEFNNIRLKFVSVRYHSTYVCAGPVFRDWLEAVPPSGTELQTESA